jgi:hypothetical protein
MIPNQSFSISKLTLFGLVLTGLSLQSCLRKPEACIAGMPDRDLAVGETVTLTSCGEGKKFMWDIYDGSSQNQYEGESVTFTVERPFENGFVHLIAEAGAVGSVIRDSDEFQIDFRVTRGSYILFVADNRYYQGMTGIEGVANAEVSLYASSDCWKNGEASSDCLVSTVTTDAQGFANIPADLPPATYIASVTGPESTSNWSNNIRDMEVSFEESQLFSSNEIDETIIVSPDPKRILVEASQWELVDVEVNSASIWSIANDCIKDNYLTFEPDGGWMYNEGSLSCSPSTASSGSSQVPSSNEYPFPTIEWNMTNVNGDGGIFHNGFARLENETDLSISWFDTSTSTNSLYIFKRVD